MSERQIYKNPPIEEALCEFRFLPSQDWDLTIPGKVHLKLGTEYSGKPQEQKVVNFALNAQEGQPPNISYGEGLAKVQLLTENARRIVAIGSDVLSVHMLRPYQITDHGGLSGWDEFKPRIKQALDAYWEVAQPQGVVRVGIRYINRIVIPEAEVRVEDYLLCALPVVAGLPNIQTNFMSRVEYQYDDGVCLVLSQGAIEAPPGHVGFLLDLDVTWDFPEYVNLDKSLAIADNLRERERTAFEAIITNKARELFNAD